MLQGEKAMYKVTIELEHDDVGELFGIVQQTMNRMFGIAKGRKAMSVEWSESDG